MKIHYCSMGLVIQRILFSSGCDSRQQIFHGVRQKCALVQAAPRSSLVLELFTSHGVSNIRFAKACIRSDEGRPPWSLRPEI
mmetsp:Transcript_104935/g.165637  ORF Transcript_104935/g.165637 Transcript_104935/m.165637 type:complete len:82 (+) Transcript_104935:1344-1589(+)